MHAVKCCRHIKLFCIYCITNLLTFYIIFIVFLLFAGNLVSRIVSLSAGVFLVQ